MNLLTTPRNDMCYCPGCSHGLVLERLAAAIEASGRRPEQVCVVSDIGCIGTADRYFECHTFHGLHGRSITYAEGIQRVRPETTVVVLIGDGGCGIGTAHLVHAARRRAGIKVIVCNNFNFGMTGGQHSPTTPPEGRTSTTPGGAGDHPFDICETVRANGADFVARGSALDPSIGTLIGAALNAPGFALIDVWELCTAYYVPSNKLTPPRLVELSQRLNMPFGVLFDRTCGPKSLRAAEAAPAATPSHLPHDQAPPAESQAATADVVLSWPERTEICVAGSAGQHIRSAAGTIGKLAVAGGLFAAQQDDFPITVRRGHSLSNLIIATTPIEYAGLDRPGLVVLLSRDGLERLGGLAELPADCVVVAASELALPPAPARVLRFDAEPLARAVGRASVALSALAFGLVEKEWIDPAALRGAAHRWAGGEYKDADIRAVDAGTALSRGAVT